MPWYGGVPLLEHLESVHVADDRNLDDVRFPVQWVIRDHDTDYRGYAGQVAGGILRPGDEVQVLPSGARTRIARIDTFDGPVDEAFAPMSVTLLLEDEIDVSRGDLVCAVDGAPELAREVEATVCWMTDAPLRAGATLRDQARHARRARDRRRGRRPRRRPHAASPTPTADELAPQRHRPRAPAHLQAARVRPVRAQPRDRLVHPHRRGHERHRRRGHDLLSAPPGAPWHSAIDALLWLHRAVPDASEVLPAQLRAGAPVTMGGLISYRSGPVGPYGEVFGAPIMVRGAPLLSHIAFMAVDSEPSVAGGRANWALPKELAEFDGDPGLAGSVACDGAGWALRVTATARARDLPFAMTLRGAQVWPDGAVRAFSVRMRGRARLARAEVEHLVASPLSGWLVDGDHTAVLVAGEQHVSPAVTLRP